MRLGKLRHTLVNGKRHVEVVKDTTKTKETPKIDWKAVDFSSLSRGYIGKPWNSDEKIIIGVRLHEGATRPEWLMQCLESIAAQTYRDFSVVLCFDGMRETAEYLGKKLGLEVVSTNRPYHLSHMSGLFRELVERSKAEYFHPQDFDDYLEPDYLEKAITGIQEHGVDHWSCMPTRVDENGQRMASTWPNKTIEEGFRLGVCQIHHSSSLIRMGSIISAGNYLELSTKVGDDDFSLWKSMADNNRSFYRDELCHSFYRKHQNQSTKNFTEKPWNEIGLSDTVRLLADRPKWIFDITADNIMNYFPHLPARKYYYPEYREKKKALLFWWNSIGCVDDKKGSLVYICDELSWSDEDIMELSKSIGGFCVVSKRLMEKVSKIKTDVPVYLTYQGIDTKKFFLKDKIYSEKLRIGWAGNSNLSLRGTIDLKGVGILKNVAEKTSDKFEWDFVDRDINFKEFSEMPDWYNSLDVYVCASIAEGVPSTILESLACGCLVVTTNVGIVQELLDDGCLIKVCDRTEKSFFETISAITREEIELARVKNPVVIKEKWGFDKKRYSWTAPLFYLKEGRRPKVAICSDSSYSGGASRCSYDMIESLEGIGVDVDHFSCDAVGCKHPDEMKDEYDIIINNLSISFKKQYKRFKSKMVNMVHTDCDWTTNRLRDDPEFVQNVCKWIIVDKSLEQRLSEFGVDSNKVSHVYLTARKEFSVPSREEKRQIKKELGLNRNKIMIYCGRFSEEKQLLSMIDVFGRALKSDKSVRMMFVGGQDAEDKTRSRYFSREEQRLRDYIGEKGLEEYCIFTGLIKSGIEKYYKASDCAILTSKFEGLPYFLLEAISCGVRFVSPNVGMIKELSELTEMGSALDREGGSSFTENDLNNFSSAVLSEMSKSDSNRLSYSPPNQLKSVIRDMITELLMD